MFALWAGASCEESVVSVRLASAIGATHIHHVASTRSLCLHPVFASESRLSRSHPLYHRGAIIGHQSCARVETSVGLSRRLDAAWEVRKRHKTPLTWSPGPNRTAIVILVIPPRVLGVAPMVLVVGHCDLSLGLCGKRKSGSEESRISHHDKES